MAKTLITELFTIGGNRYHEWTSWRVYKDEARTDLLVENLEDPINKMSWDNPLIDSDGNMYNGDSELYASVQIKFDGRVGPWVDMAGCSILKSGPLSNCIGFTYDLPLEFGCKEEL